MGIEKKPCTGFLFGGLALALGTGSEGFCSLEYDVPLTP